MSIPKTPEQKAHRKEWLHEYRKRPEVAARISTQAKGYAARPADKARATEYKREFIQRKRAEGLHTETLVTRAEFAVMLAAQGGVCAICQNPETKLSAKGRVRRLSVDHDHATGRVRALLCSRCNSAVGFLDDDPRLAERLLAYMREQEGQAIAWRMEEAIGSERPVVTRRHRVEALQVSAAQRMQEAIG